MLATCLHSWPSLPVPPAQASRHASAPQHRRGRCVLARDGKMYVPSDSFGGLSPEKKASQALESLLTFTAAKIVLAQLEGSGRGALAAYNQTGYSVLSRQLQEVSLRDPDAWLDDLIKKDKGIALRLMEVRAAYATTDFEWDQLQRLSVKAIKDSNLALMRKAATASLQASTAAAPAAAAAAAAAAGVVGAEQEGATEAATATAPVQQQQGQPAVAPAAEQQQQQLPPAQRQEEQQQQRGREQAATQAAAAAPPPNAAAAAAAAGNTTDDQDSTVNAPAAAAASATTSGAIEGPGPQPGHAAAEQDAVEQQQQQE